MHKTVTVKLNQKSVKVCNTVITVRKDLYLQSNKKQTQHTKKCST